MLNLWIKRHLNFIDGNEAYLLAYPVHVRRAFAVTDFYYFLNEEELDDRSTFIDHMKEAIQVFATRWGGLEEPVFLRVLEQGTTMECLVAIFAIGWSTLPQAGEVLIALLASTKRLERCAAACLLGVRHDERANAALEDYLLHDAIDEDGKALPEAFIWYQEYYCVMALVLATWGPPAMTEVLYQTVVRIWNPAYEKSIGRDEEAPAHLLYALGRRGKLSVINTLQISAPQRQMALICLALGYLNAFERFDNLYWEVQENKTLQQELFSVWQKQFGLSKKEAQDCLHAFERPLLKG